MRLLRALGHFYSRHGNHERALALLLLAHNVAPDDVGVLRSLTNVFLIQGDADNALAVIERLAQQEPRQMPALMLLKGRALWMQGRTAEARRAFRDYVEHRGRP